MTALQACSGNSSDSSGVSTSPTPPSPPPPTNSAPVISGTPVTLVRAGLAYEFTPTASDPDGDPIQFSITGQPVWSAFDLDTGLLQGIPTDSDVGLYADIVISVSDGNTTASLAPFEISVDPNATPVISGTPVTSVRAGSAYEFTPAASDPDGDPIQFLITGQPDWSAFDSETGLLQGVPTESDIGLYADIVIAVSDGNTTASLAAFEISVDAVGPLPAAFGLDTRPSNSSCIAVQRPESAGISLQRVFPSLPLSGVTAVVQPPNDATAWFFTTRDGLIGRFDNVDDASSITTVLDFTATVTTPSDGGLVQMVFHPDYPGDRRVFVMYSMAPLVSGATADIVISSFELSANGSAIDPQTETMLIRWPRGPFHQGGFMAFDADGLLLVGFGDGADQGDPDGHAQDLNNLLGKMLRLDVDSGDPYSIPDDNPFAGSGGSPREEIYAYGLRNPWRGDVDSETGRIYVADVGRSRREEVSSVVSGGNLGWNIKEGTTCHSEQYGRCNDKTLIDPLIEYKRTNGNCAVIGGYFYRGSAIPNLTGRYLFGDFCSSKISAVDFDDSGQPFELSLIPTGAGPGRIYTFAKDNDGELYVVTPDSMHKIVPNTAAAGPSGPASQLSQTGCFDSADPQEPAAGLIPYELKASLWSDGASKRRWIALPDGRTIDIAPDGDLLFPEGTVLVKEFSVDGEPIETRLLMRDDDGVWTGYSYEWDGNDAFLLLAGNQKVLDNGQVWNYPDRGECLRCHTDEANISLGPELAQLNGDMAYEQTNRLSNQLATMNHIGLFTNGLPDTPDQLQALAGIDDTHQALSRRARGYLHANCSGCHRGQGATQSTMDLRFSVSRAGMNVCNISPSLGDLGISGARLLAPGRPDLSILMQRPASTDPRFRMPPLATAIVHDEATDLLRAWIQSTNVCAAESDSDLDAVPDDADNCPLISNPNQADVDRDGTGDACEAD